MECFEVDTKIISYLENTLEDDELEAFLEHLNECEDCRNEVALYFTLIEGLKQMDEDEIKIFDFQAEYQKQRKERLRDVVLRRKYRLLTIYGFFQKYENDRYYLVQEDCYEQQISID